MHVDITHPVESWSLFFRATLTVLVPFDAAFVEAGFFVSVVFAFFFAVDLFLSPDGGSFAVVAAPLLASLGFPLSFPCLEGVCKEVDVAGLTGFLLLFMCLHGIFKRF